jgi:hypothetical protein
MKKLHAIGQITVIVLVLLAGGCMIISADDCCKIRKQDQSAFADEVARKVVELQKQEIQKNETAKH